MLNGIFLNGENEGIHLFDKDVLVGQGNVSFTLEAWIRTTASGRRMQIFSFGSEVAQGQSAWFFVNEAGYLGFDLRGWGGPVSAQRVNDGQWHHVAVVGRQGDYQLYVDGVRSGGNARGATDIRAGEAWIGAATRVWDVPGHNQWRYRGDISEVRVWAAALNDAEIKTAMTTRPRGDAAKLVGYWRLDARTEVFEDVSLGRHDARFVARPNTTTNTTVRPVRPLTGIQLDGERDAIHLFDSDAPVGTGNVSFTIGAWICTSESGRRMQIVNFGSEAGPGQSVWLYVNEGGYLAFDLRGWGGPISNVKVNDGKWHHVVLVGNAGVYSLYLDGRQTGETKSGMTDLRWGEGWIGAASRQWDVPGHQRWRFKGELAEVAIWNRALLPEEIAAGTTPAFAVAGFVFYGMMNALGPYVARLERFPLQTSEPTVGPAPLARTTSPTDREVIFEKSAQFEFYTTPDVPSNLNIFDGDGQAAAALSILTFLACPGAQIALGASGSGAIDWFTPEMAERLSKIEFARAPATTRAGTRSRVDFKVLKRSDGRIDFGIMLHNTYTTTYAQNQNDDAMFRSLYQDQVTVRIAPHANDCAQLVINDSAVFPVTNNNSAAYSTSVGWTASAGFDAVSPSGSISYSVTSEASTSYNEFMIEKKTQGDSDRIQWMSRMRTLYKEDKYVDSRIYQSPEDIIVKGVFVQWLLVPPAIATTDMDQQYLAGYTSNDASILNGKVTFKIEIVQQLQYAQTVGRGGVSGAKVGGTSLVLPYQILGVILCHADLANGYFAIESLPVYGMNAKQLANTR